MAVFALLGLDVLVPGLGDGRLGSRAGGQTPRVQVSVLDVWGPELEDGCPWSGAGGQTAMVQAWPGLASPQVVLSQLHGCHPPARPMSSRRPLGCVLISSGHGSDSIKVTLVTSFYLSPLRVDPVSTVTFWVLGFRASVHDRALASLGLCALAAHPAGHWHLWALGVLRGVAPVWRLNLRSGDGRAVGQTHMDPAGPHWAPAPSCLPGPFWFSCDVCKARSSELVFTGTFSW